MYSNSVATKDYLTLATTNKSIKTAKNLPYPSIPSTAWNNACRAWLMIWPFQASVSV